MLKGSALFFTYIFTLAFTKKRLRLNQHLWMISIVLSLGLIGYSNIGSTHEKCSLALTQSCRTQF